MPHPFSEETVKAYIPPLAVFSIKWFYLKGIHLFWDTETHWLESTLLLSSLVLRHRLSDLPCPYSFSLHSVSLLPLITHLLEGRDSSVVPDLHNCGPRAASHRMVLFHYLLITVHIHYVPGTVLKAL